MAIFKRNRNRAKKQEEKPIIETAVETAAQQSEEAQEAATEAASEAAEAAVQENAPEFTPVLAFGTQPAATVPTPAVQQPKPTAEDEVAGELDSIANIFGAEAAAAKPTAANIAAAENVSAAQSRWRSRRQKAMEQARLAQEQQAQEAAKLAGEAPVIEPMKSVPLEKRSKKYAERPAPPETPVSLAFADLSGRDDLAPWEIDYATEIYGIKYPAHFDTSEPDYAGRAIDYSNFSLCEGLRWAHIAQASDISGVVFPSTFDIDHAEFFGRSIRACDFSAVYALKWKHIEAADDIVAVKYPATFDIQNASFASRNISGSDFSLVQGLQWENIEKATDLSGIKYPATFDIENTDYSGKDISGSDFSLVQGLRWEHIKDAAAIDGIIYPRDFDLENADFRGLDISSSDFTRAQSFEYKCIAGAADIRKIKYPSCYDSAGARYDGLNISGSNFSRVSTLRWEHIKKASNITRLVYPPQFDIDEADFTDRDIDYSDFSLLPGFNWHSVRLADSREGLIYPAGFVVPKNTPDEVQGSMLIFLLKLYHREYKGAVDEEQFADDIAALYPGIDESKAAELIDNASARWDRPDGRRLVELTAREAHIGDKLFLVKLGFKLLYPRHGAEVTETLLREQFGGLFKKHERDRFDKRISELRMGHYLSAAELQDIGYEPETPQKTERSVEIELPTEVQTEIEAVEQTETTESAVEAIDEQTEETQFEVPEGASVHTFGYVQPTDIDIDEEGIEIPDEPMEEDEPADIDSIEPVATSESLQRRIAMGGTSGGEAAQEQPAADRFTAKPVDLSKLRSQRGAKKKASAAPSSRKEKLSDDEKAIRTGVMGMLLYIHQNSSDEEMTTAEMYTEFMKLYSGAAPKEAAAMAQFAANTLNGTNNDTRAKLFMFAARSPASIKRKLLDFAYDRYVYRLSETADEEIFRGFLMALCETLYEDSPEYEYSSYLRSRGILKDPPLRREASYRRISFESNLGKANLYANGRYPFYRTLEQVGFQHFTFDAIRGNLLIEVSDSRYYEELQNLVYRERRPNLLEFVIIETQMGYLYLEQRCLDDWQVDERDVWAAAEKNMRGIDLRAKYSFSTSDFSSFRYIQHDLASYVLAMPDLMAELAYGQDLILSIPCREIVYIDFYDFGAIKKMLEFSSRYNCTLIINGDEYEHPFSSDVFIYHAADGSFERVNDETYILLGDSVARRQVLRTVLPLNVDFSQEALVEPHTTDEVAMVTEEQCQVQEAVFTLLRLYSEMNGDTDYTIPQNAMMAVVDELYMTFDAVYPPARGREQPDPMDHLVDAARMAIKGGKTMCWLMIQALQYMCGDIKYETPSSAHIRETVLSEIYGHNANAVWLNCATATDFQKRYEAVRRYHEKPVENQHLNMLDSKLELAMHVLTMLFHQFGQRYALGEVRRHLYRVVQNVSFTYEINQSAWLPSPSDNIDVDAQSLGMIFRGFDRATQERMLTAFADAIGDRDLSEGGWPLLYFIKFVKYAYLDPVEMVERYFVRRSRLVPSQSVLRSLYYKDLNNEFVKHSRRADAGMSMASEDTFDERARKGAPETLIGGESFESLLAIDTSGFDTPVTMPKQEETAMSYQRPDLQLAPVETGYIEKKLSFVLEPIDEKNSEALRSAAHYVTKVFHVPEVMFKTNDDIECELHYGIIRSKEQITALRSFAWTLASLIIETGRDMKDVTDRDVARAVEIVEDNNLIAYKPNTKYFPVLCSMPLDEGMYVPCYQEYIFFAQELLPETPLASLFALQDELIALAPSMKLVYDMLREQKRGDIMPPRGVMFDALCAWSAYSFSAGAAFEVVKGPQMYNYNQITR